MKFSRHGAARLVAAAASASGATALLRRARRRRGDYRVFILEYHDVSRTGREREGVVSARRLRQHLRYLQRHYRLVSLAAAVDYLATPRALNQDLACLTLDDGYAGAHEAWKILRAAGVPACVFLTTGFLDGSELWFDAARRCLEALRRRGHAVDVRLRQDLRQVFGHWPLRTSTDAAIERLKYLAPALRDSLLVRLGAASPPLSPPVRPLSWSQVREMLATGIEIGCHTVSHPILSALPPPRQAEEIYAARDRIALQTGVVPVLFAYPNGAGRDFDSATMRILRQAGFRAACTTMRGSNRPGCDPFLLRRIGVGTDPCFVLAARLAGLFDDSVRAQLSRRQGFLPGGLIHSAAGKRNGAVSQRWAKENRS